ncbi:hypothetical protein L1987_80026 [Smallanthus sonchifolius]|uniref:Uncharacterized protein n=1 Tax=Smallanthus sonchifolius TaxID=185202 RepID=A0ACB8YML0_9ASTR|nr:hypothetical protein L1987_80026 [Smallanthus sonchifolius]
MDGKVNLFKIKDCANKLLAADSDQITWLINWNTEFNSSTGQFFLPAATQEALASCFKKHTLKKWLTEEVKVKFVSVGEYADDLIPSLKYRKLAVTYAHFLYHSLKKSYLMEHQVLDLCSKMPIVDNYGQVTVRRDGVLVPANGSEDLVKFMKKYVGASDVPYLSPPDAAVPTLSSPLTKINTFLLLQWLNTLRTKNVPLLGRFMSSIKDGSWLKISLSGCPAYRPPNESFLFDTSSGSILQNGSVRVDIPLVDVNFYGENIKKYKEELRTIGVQFENKDACEYVGKRLMSLAASSNLTRDNVVSILKFIQYLGVNYISSEALVNTIKQGKWVRTSQGEMIPKNSVLFSNEWNAASQLSNIPFIDKDYYGREVFSFKKELEMLGVVVKFDESCYQLVSDNLKSSSLLTSLSSEATLLMLRCIQKLHSSDKLVQAIKHQKCIKTNLGYRCPSECFLVTSETEWGCLLQVFGSFPIVDKNFYGSSIFSMEKELKKIGVMVDFENAAKEFTRTFKQQASSSSIRKENVFSFLKCFRKLKKLNVKFPEELRSCIRKEKWLRTRLGDYRSPNDSDNFYGGGIRDYKVELKLLGVTTEFKDGAKFVAAGLVLPECSSSITPASIYALLDSVKRLEESASEILAKFTEKLSQKSWLRTRCGYKCLEECLFFYSDWEPFLKRDDGPFIDEQFYGSRIGSYKEVLNLLGVITNVDMGCQLIASYLYSQSNFQRINRFYNYLSEFKWKPDDEDNKKIWIPRGTDNGEWVTPQDCVHDKNSLFDGQLSVLEKFRYEMKILAFFADTFSVKVHPSVDDYCKLWNKWENSDHQITHTECCAFWEFVVKTGTQYQRKCLSKAYQNSLYHLLFLMVFFYQTSVTFSSVMIFS